MADVADLADAARLTGLPTEIELTADERTTLSVLAFLFFRMGMDDRARRVYEALAELSLPGSPDRRFALSGIAAAALEAGDGGAALEALRGVLDGRPLGTKEAPALLLKARALWLLDRKDEARSVRDEYLYLTVRAASDADHPFAP